jgi:hypothetical protein
VTNRAQFAGLLAQVIPVIALAVIVESRSAHGQRRRRSVQEADYNWRSWHTVLALAWEALLLILMAFLETAALLTAAGRTELAWFAGVPGAIAVAMLLVFASLIYIQTLAGTYQRDGVINETELRVLNVGIYWAMGIAGAAAIAGVVYFA